MKTEYEHVRFVFVSSERWSCFCKVSGRLYGCVLVFEEMKEILFAPESEWFDQGMLRDISDFLDALNAEKQGETE